jgi:hypothetical protein
MNYIIHPDKIEKYLLDVSHPAGAPKARFFVSRSFTLAKPHELADALKRHPLEANLTDIGADPEGRRLTYECDIRTPDGSRICIRTVWIEAPDGSHTRLITAYPFQ